MIELSGIDPEKKVNVITKEERLGFVRLIKNLECTLTGLRDYNEAIITKGGINDQRSRSGNDGIKTCERIIILPERFWIWMQ